MKEYLTFEHVASWGLSTLQKARRLTEEEKKDYAEWYREIAFTPTGESVELEYLSYSDAEEVIGDRESDGSFAGCSNAVWIITQEQWDTLVEINHRKGEERKERERQKEILQYREIILACECQRVLYTVKEAEAKAKEYNDIYNDGGYGYVPHYCTVDEYRYAKKRLAELGFVEEEKTDVPANVLVLTARDEYGNSCTIKFTENGWEVVDQTEKKTFGYLHVDFDSPKNVTPGVCESLIKYFYNHDMTLPGLGATPQQKYLYNYSMEERERIGNDGKPGFYA